MQDQGCIIALFLGIGELQPYTGDHAPGACSDIHGHTVAAKGTGQRFGSVSVMLCIGAEFQLIGDQIDVERIIKPCQAVTCIQSIYTGNSLGIQGGYTVTQGGNTDITLFPGKGCLVFLNDALLAVDIHTVAYRTRYGCPGGLIAGDGDDGILQRLCNGNAVHIQRHVIVVASISVEAKLNGIGRITAFVEGSFGIVGGIGIHTNILHRCRLNVEGHPLACFQTADAGGEGSCGSILRTEFHIVTGKEEIVLNMLAFHIDPNCQVLPFQVFPGKAFGNAQPDSIVTPAYCVIEGQIDLQHTLSALEFFQPGIGIIISDLIVLVGIAAFH